MTQFSIRHMAAIVAVTVLQACGAARDLAETPGPIGPDPLTGTIWDVAASAEIDAETLVARLGEADLVILGEVHDNPTHHARQAWTVAALDPSGLAFEMVGTDRESEIAAFRADGGTPAGIGELIGWAQSGWPDWSMYAPIFEAAPDAAITGGASPREEVRRAFAEGAATVWGAGADQSGLTDPLPPGQQAEAEAEMVASHCGMLPPDRAGGMVEAQRLRDARFADALVRAAGAGTAVLITGNGHARTDRGVPLYLARQAPGARVLSVGQIEVRDGATTLADHAEDGRLPYDFVWFSERVADRPDPCAAFRSG